jgi:hypothetical protein
MLETTGSIFDSKADALCVPTNGVVKGSGDLVMGKGLAKLFAQRYPGLPRQLGDHVQKAGNVPCLYRPDDKFGVLGKYVISFPTKHHWSQPSDLVLIERSARCIVSLVEVMQLSTIALSRVGCGLGHLDWDTQVKPLLTQILDDRFTVVHKAPALR